MAQQRPPLDGVFISYRRDDNPYPAAWLYANLSAKFGDERVFKDVDSISPGAVFEEEIAGPERLQGPAGVHRQDVGDGHRRAGPASA
jgi:hypothetical protein